jgi:hypothetical protein
MVFFGLGLLALLTAFGIWRKNQRFKAWVTAPGVVLSSAVTGFDNDFVAIEYEYTVHGRRHVGKGLNPSNTSTDATAAVRRYPAGKHVTVHFDPQDPSACALEPNHGGGVVFVSAIGLLMCAFALFAPID